MEIFIGLTAADGYKTLTADLGSDQVVSTGQGAVACVVLPER